MSKVIRWILLGAAAVFLIFHVYVAVMLWWWKDHAPQETRFMAIQAKRLEQERPGSRLRYRWVSYVNISTALKRAVIASEDAKFADHDGFDFDGAKKAFDKNLRKGHIVAGGSTISQQLAKNLFLSPEKSYVRKAEEVIITLMLEAMLDKRRILELYLNVVEWGDGIFGAQEAARYYYGESARQLGVVEAAKLAAMLPNPRFFDHHRQHPRLMHHADVIKQRMMSAELP